MKFLLSFYSVLLLAVATSAIAAPLEITSRPVAVTVYPDRALVTRSAEFQIPAGETEVTLAGLPANLWDASLQVRGDGPAGTTILDVNSRNIFVEATVSPELKQLEDVLNALRREDTAFNDESQSLNQERDQLEQIMRAATTVPAESPSFASGPEQWGDLLQFSATENRRITKAQREISQQREALRAQLEAAQNQLNEARGRQPGRRAIKQVVVRVASPSAGPGSLQVSYTVPGANWSPVYNARLDSTTRTVAFDYQAQVMNRTGEAWEKVALTLSTARPSAGGSAPEPRPWIVAENRPMPPPPMADDAIQLSPFSVTSESNRGFAAKSTLAGARMQTREATVETGLTAATFKITAPATVPSDGTMQKVSVTTVTLPAGLSYAATPKYVPSAFLNAQVNNTTQFPLLAGQLSAFVDGAFIAESSLELTMPNEAFDLALGVDEAVAIERTLINRFVEKTGFTNSGTRVTYETKIALTNNKSIPVTLKLSEPLPVSRHEKIIVKLIEPAERDIGGEASAKTFQRDDEGILTWTGTLTPGASRDVTLKFSIEYPNDLSVTGIE